MLFMSSTLEQNLLTASSAMVHAVLQMDADRREAGPQAVAPDPAEGSSAARKGGGGPAASGLVGRSRFVQLPRLVKSAGQGFADPSHLFMVVHGQHWGMIHLHIAMQHS